MAAHAKRATKQASEQDKADDRRQKIKLGAAVAGLVAAATIFWYQLSHKSEAEAASNTRVLQCASTKGTFPHDLVLGEIPPVKCDICGQNDAYNPEACYWTKDADGKWAIKDKPTYVILPNRMDPEGANSIACPDCGRRVVGHNPRPDQAAVDRANGAATSEEPDDESGG